MKLKVTIAFLFLLFIVHTNAINFTEQLDSLNINKFEVYDTDSLLNSYMHDPKVSSNTTTDEPVILPQLIIVPLTVPELGVKLTDTKSDSQQTVPLLLVPISETKLTEPKTEPQITLPKQDAKLTVSKPENELIIPKEDNKLVEIKTQIEVSDLKIAVKKLATADTAYLVPSPDKILLLPLDTLSLFDNPFFIEMVYMGMPLNFNWDIQPDFGTLYFGGKVTTLNDGLCPPVKVLNSRETLVELRRSTRGEFARKAAHLYVLSFSDLPDPDKYKSHLIEGRERRKVEFVDEDTDYDHIKRNMHLRKMKLNPWYTLATTMAQFSQNYVSENWYQGGNSNVAVLGIVTGKLNYDDKKIIQWENNLEWRMGFNSVSGDTLRMLNTNDDVLKINSKLGIKASGNWFYSGSVDFSTQFFNSYAGVNSPVLKTTFLTPVRLNVGFGFDYKYQKIFSLMIAPVAFKYIYVDNDIKINPNLFGIETGKNVLMEVGSALKAQLTYCPSHEIQLDSKFSFYTNYKKVEIDWEIVCNLTINRFLSTRISFNPRYDNTVIQAEGQKAQMQFKQLMSVGFSHKFR